MHRCSDHCVTDCDYCAHYCDFYDCDDDGDIVPTGFGFCEEWKEIVSLDSSCDNFYCRIARRNALPEIPHEDAMREQLSRRYLKTFACGTAHKFASSAVHYAWLAHHYGIARVTIDLLALTIEPPEFNIRRNRILAGQCRDSLLCNAKRLKPPGAVTAATLAAEFGIHEHGVDDHFEWIGPSTFTVILTDDRGKEWRGKITLDRVLAQGDGVGDPNR